MDEHSVSGVILAGGSSSRLGANKALLPAAGETLIERVVHALAPLVAETIVITNDPQLFSELGLRCVPDQHQGAGVLGGVHAGLGAMHAEHALVVGCDMPFLNQALLRHMISLRRGHDAVMPRHGTYFEPLHAVYARRCLPVFEDAILAGERRLLIACQQLDVRYVEAHHIAELDPRGLSFFNVNTPADLMRMNELLAHS